MSASSFNPPIVDLQNCSAEDLVSTLERASCVLLKNHGVDDEVRTRVLRASDAFFALPRTEKERVEWPGEGFWYGWQPVHEMSATADLMERYEVRLPAHADKSDPQRWADAFLAWPQHPEDLRPAYTQLYVALHKLASDIMSRLAKGLGRSGESLDKWTDLQHSNLVFNHYAPQPETVNGRFRAHPHTDIGAITLLWADQAPGGLEVESQGGWQPVQVPESLWVLQVGDLLHLWSDHQIAANRHRVINPPSGRTDTTRRSIVFFHHPDPSVVVSAPSSSETETLTAGEYMLFRQAQDVAPVI